MDVEVTPWSPVVVVVIGTEVDVVAVEVAGGIRGPIVVVVLEVAGWRLVVVVVAIVEVGGAGWVVGGGSTTVVVVGAEVTVVVLGTVVVVEVPTVVVVVAAVVVVAPVVVVWALVVDVVLAGRLWCGCPGGSVGEVVWVVTVRAKTPSLQDTWSEHAAAEAAPTPNASEAAPTRIKAVAAPITLRMSRDIPHFPSRQFRSSTISLARSGRILRRNHKLGIFG